MCKKPRLGLGSEGLLVSGLYGFGLVPSLLNN